MKRFHYIIMIAMLAVMPFVNSYVEDDFEAEIKADFVSQYIWRGQDVGDFSVQPTLGVSWKGLSLSAWGSVGMKSRLQTRLPFQSLRQ